MRKIFQRQDTPRTFETNSFEASSGKKPKAQKLLSFQHQKMMPPSISIECVVEDSSDDKLKKSPSTELQLGKVQTPSSNSTQRGFSSLDTDRDVDTPILDEFAQYLNASIHPPNELSVPRCYPETTLQSPTRLSAPSTAPSSRRPSASARGGSFLLNPGNAFLIHKLSNNRFIMTLYLP